MATVEHLIEAATSRGYRVRVTLDRRGELPGGPVELTISRGRRHHLRLLTLPPLTHGRPATPAPVADYVITNVTVDDSSALVAGSSYDARSLWKRIHARALVAPKPRPESRPVAVPAPVRRAEARPPEQNPPPPAGRRAHLIAFAPGGRAPARPQQPRPHRFGGMSAAYNFTRKAAHA